jgi:alkylated DNA repair dioxygenase AlkB
MAGGAQLCRGWAYGTQTLLAALRECFTYHQGRAGGHLYESGTWVEQFALRGPHLLAAASAWPGVAFTSVSFQAYLDGSGCDWHTDKPYGDQAILSLGVTRSFGLRPPGGEPQWFAFADGDLLFMPERWAREDWEHSVAHEAVPGERCSLVFRAWTEEA